MTAFCYTMCCNPGFLWSGLPRLTNFNTGGVNQNISFNFARSKFRISMIKTTQMSQTEPELSFFLPAAILMVWLAALLSVFLPGVIVPILLAVPIVVALA